MGYLFESELRNQAEKFILALMADGISGSIAPDGFRDYLVKINITSGQKLLGNINLYYSPNKQSFSLKTHELRDKSIAPEIQAAWARQFYAKKTPSPNPDNTEVTAPWEYEAYVDGSFTDGRVGYGTLILKAGEPVFEIGGRVENPTLLDMRQVGGELQAVYAAIDWCENNQVQGISIFYDYEGIERWATGSWKANNPATQAYSSFMRACGIQIVWNKVKSHAGNPWNEYVDRLAKQGSQSSTPASKNTDDQLTTIHQKAQEFTALLQNEKITATVAGIMNGQFVRIMVRPRGQLDIYSTRRRSPDDPYLTNFVDASLQQKVEALWKSFYRGEETANNKIVPIQDALLAEAEYLYKIMVPYRNCWFDFSDLANALEKVYKSQGRLNEPVEILEKAYDFNALEKTYRKIKGA